MTFVRPATERWDHPALAETIDLRERARPAAAPASSTSASATSTPVEATVTAIDLSSIRVVGAFLACGYAVLMVACVVLWVTASVVGLVSNVESFIRDTGFDTFRFAPIAILRAMLLAGVVLVAAGTVAAALAIILYNRLAERVPGLRFTTSLVDGPREEPTPAPATLVPCPPTPARWSPSIDASTMTSPVESGRSRPPI